MDKNIHSLKASELEVVLKTSQAVSRTLDLKEILKIACRMTAQALEADRCSIGLLNAKGTYEIAHVSYLKKTSYPSISGKKFNLMHYPLIAGKLIEKKAIHILLDRDRATLSRDEKNLFKQLNLKVFLGVPITTKGEPIGALHLGRVEASHPFSPSDIKLCQTIANQIGIAIKNATLVKELKEGHQLLEKQSEDLKIRFQQQKLVLDISKSLFRSSNLQEVFNIITQKTCAALGLDRCTILQFDSEQKEAVIRSIFRSLGPSGNGTHDSSNLGKNFRIKSHPRIFELLLKKGFLLTEDFQPNLLLPRTRRYLKDLKVKSTLTIPFYSGKKISGSLHLSTHKDYHRFTDSEVKLCQTISNLASMALENVKLMENLQEKSITLQQQAKVLVKQYREQTILLEISKAMSRTLDLKKLFEIVTQRTTKLIGVDRCVIMLMDEASKASIMYKVYSTGRYRPEYEGIQRSMKDFRILVRHLMKNPHLFCTTEVSRSNLSSKEKNVFEKEGIKSLLVIPFYFAGKNLGLLALSTLHRQHKFTESEINLGQAIANQLTMTVENARLMQDLQEKNIKINKQTEVLEKQFNEQRILLEISKALSQTLDLKELFNIVTQKTVELLGTDRAVAMIIDQKTGNHSLFVHYSRIRDILELSDFPKNISEFPYLIEKSRTGRVYSVFDTEKSSISLREKSYFKKRKIKSVLVVPFVLKGKLLGVLSLNNIREKRMFTDSEIKLVQAIANQLAIAVENANLMEISKKHSEELEKLSLQIINAQEEERKIIAGKLHDVVGQDLTALRLDLKMSKQEIPEQFTRIRDRLEEGERLAKQALESVRNLTMDLRPPILDDFGLASAIRWYVDGFSRRTNIKVVLKLQELDCKLPPEFETAIYRAIQECLTNVAKHSEASRVNISLDKKNEHLQIMVQDYGIGFEPGIFHFTSGFGLFRLKEKTELLGGKFKINSKKGKGTRVVIIFPCKK
jgi:GAF domain-containing protein/anti-sigma regulatory factor (Ser/Thr protein kinase)